jgi:enamine deaminase RidA (YjgF/YER057c/UK114 family)
MTRKLISSGSRFEEIARYSRAVVEGEWIFVSGTVGADPADGSIPPSVEQQARNSFAHIERALREGGATLNDVYRCRVYATDIEAMPEIVKVLAEKFADVRPANTTIICQLPVAGARVEIEVSARRRPG